MSLHELLTLALLAILAENVVLVQLLGADSFLGSSGRMGPALGMGVMVTFLMALSSLCTWVVNTYLLVPFGLDGFLQTLAFVLVVAALSQLTLLLLRRLVPTLYAALDSCRPLIAANCAILGVALLNTQRGGALESALYGLFAGLGFTLVLILFTSVRERLAFADCPKAFAGLPIALVTAGLLAMAFMGFAGLRLG